MPRNHDPATQPPTSSPTFRPSRRWLLRGAGTAAIALAGVSPLSASRAAAGLLAGRDYATKGTFDWALGVLKHYSPSDTNEESNISFVNAYYLKSMMVMYHRFGDILYLDKFRDMADAILVKRDNARGVTDYRGRSLPLWRKGNHETTGARRFSGTNGVLFQLRQGFYDANGSRTAITISDGTIPHHFTITRKFTNLNSYEDTFTNVNLDPSSPDYIVNRLYWATPNVTRTTAIDLRTGTINPTDMPMILVGSVT